MRKRVPDWRVCAILALAGFAPAAHAYLDPSTGSMILSAIVGIFATLSLAIKTYWYKLKSFFNGKAAADRQRRDTEESSESGES